MCNGEILSPYFGSFNTHLCYRVADATSCPQHYVQKLRTSLVSATLERSCGRDVASATLGAPLAALPSMDGDHSVEPSWRVPPLLGFARVVWALRLSKRHSQPWAPPPRLCVNTQQGDRFHPAPSGPHTVHARLGSAHTANLGTAPPARRPPAAPTEESFG